MKLWSLLFFCLVFQTEQNKKHIVTGNIKYINAYCGGARPTDEMLRSYRTPRLFSGKKLYVRKGKINDISTPVIASLVTDSLGSFKLELVNGDYCVVSENRKDKKIYTELSKAHSKKTMSYMPIDKKCLDQWLKTPDFLFTVRDSDILITHTYNLPCSWNSLPCITYIGSLPP